MAYKGRYKPKNIQKYIGDPTKCIYRSLWERRFMKWCDENASVYKWGSEEVIVPYRSPVDKRVHRYFVDFLIVIKNKKGEFETLLIEIKPKKQCSAPKKESKTKKRYLSELKTYVINKAKWDAAEDYAIHKGWKFTILTEDNIFGEKK